MALTALLLAPLAPLALQSGFDETLVVDLNPSPTVDQVADFSAQVTDDSIAYFTVEFENRRRVAVSDGILAGTRVLDVDAPGVPDFDLQSPARFEAGFLPDGTRRAVAAARTFGVGYEPWLLDAEAGQVSRIGDIWPGTESSNPESFVTFGDAVWFLADDGVHGRELWKTDGTQAGTVLALETVPGPGSLWSEATPFRRMLATNGTLLWFIAPNAGDESLADLWVTDGTVAGLQLLVPAIESLVFTDIFLPGLFGFAGERLVFQAGAGVWTSDGTPAGTQLLSIGDAHWVVSAGPRAFLAVEDGFVDDLVVTDGTVGGTTRLTGPDVFGVIDDVGAFRGAMVGDLLVFRASATVGGVDIGAEPCVSDGTIGGTGVLVNLIETTGPSGSSSPAHFAHFDGRVYFTAQGGGTNAVRFWSTDGTPGGTIPLSPLLGAESVFPIDVADGALSRLTPTENGLFHLREVDPTALVPELESWSVDAEGAQPIPVEPEGTRDASPRELTRVGDRLFFSASASGETSARDLYVLDTGLGGLPERVDLLGPGVAADPTDLLAWNGGLAFFARTSPTPNSRAAWWTDGVDSRRLTPLGLGAATGEIASAGDRLYISFASGGGGSAPSLSPSNVFVSFGQAEDAVPIDVTPTGAFFSFGSLTGTQDGRLFATGLDFAAPFDIELYTYFEGTLQEFDLNPTAGSSPSDLRWDGDLLYFAASPGTFERDLYVSDGTQAGTLRVLDVNPPNPSLADVTAIELLEDGVLARYTAPPDQVLIRSDGTLSGTSVIDLPTGYDFDQEDSLVVNGDRAFLNWDDPTTTWVTDGTAPGSAAVPGPPESLGPWAGPGAPVGLDRVAFSSEAAPGEGLWMTDGTTGGTVPLTAYAASSEAVVPSVRAQQVGDSLFFVATSVATGEELHRIDLGALGIADVFVDEGGCGVGEDALAISGAPVLGQDVAATVDELPGGTSVASFLGVDLLPSTPGLCSIDIAPLIPLGNAVADGSGVASLTIPIPVQPSLVGRVLHLQALVIDSPGPFLGIGATTNTATLVVGQ